MSGPTISAPSPISVSVVRTREGGLLISVSYSYEGRFPSRKKRVGAARVLMREALERLKEGAAVDLGFSEDATRRVRTDWMEA